jgi:hypothetical protein
MKILYKLVLVLVLFSLNSCSKDEKEVSLIKEIDQELEMITAYKEGMDSYKGTILFMQLQNFLRLSYYFLNQIGHQNQL